MSENEGRDALRHELRTLLHQIIGYAELVADEARDQGTEDMLPDLAKIGTAARQAIEVVEATIATVARDRSPVGTPRASPAPSHRFDGVRVLVVDDDERSADVLSRRLAAGGFLVETATAGSAALEMLKAQAFDLLLLDVMMPGLSGTDVLRRVRETWTEADLPVIMVTAKDAAEDVVEALRLGANDYVTKPLDFPVVLARVETQLTVRRQNQQIRRLAEDLERRTEFIRTLFGRYLSDDVVSALLATPEGPRLGGEQRRVTLLLSDLRGFTLLTEGLPPERVLRLLNSYLGTMTDVILSHEGTVDEFVGDGILAAFGAPLTRPDDARRAVTCAIEMQAALAALSQRNEAEGLPKLEMGVALHTGEVIVGNIGSERRTKYGVVGSAVNHVGRIESFTVGGQVLLSETTLREAGEDVQVGRRLVIDAKGTREPMVVYDLRSVGSARILDAAEEPVVLKEPIEVLCRVVDGKRVEAEAFGARLVELSARGGTLIAPRRLRALSNLKLELRPAGGCLELYAKVVQASADGSVEVRFAAVPSAVEPWLRGQIAKARGAPSAG